MTQWIGVLEATMQILIVPPFYDNLGRRLVKSPKIYIADSGLACHLLGIDSAAELARSPFRGRVLEGFVASEIVKAQTAAGGRANLYYFRDEQGLEVDFVVPGRGSSVSLLECKASRTVTPDMTSALRRLSELMRSKRWSSIDSVLVHEAPKTGTRTRVVSPGVKALSWKEWVATL